MNDVAGLEARIETLEATLAFQDRTIEELAQSLVEHWKQIEALKREFAKLGTQLREVEGHPALAAAPEPPPPHY